MQQALSRPVRMNKLMAGSVAILGASAIAITPISNSPALIETQHRAVQLVADVTASPSVVYGSLFTNTITNINALQANWKANPFPLMTTLAENQAGYTKKITDAFVGLPAGLKSWYENGKGESKPGAEYLANYKAALKAGDLNLAYDNLNRFMLFGMQNLITPITGLFLTTTPRGSTTPVLGIAQQMAQNFADAVGAFFNTSTVNGGILQSIFAPISGASWEFSRAVQAISKSLAEGNLTAALNGVINTPGAVLNAFFNGFDYDEGGATAPWAGIFSGCIGKTGRCASGALEQSLITIPKKIADAIDNTPAVPAASTAAVSGAVAKEITSTETSPEATGVVEAVHQVSVAAAPADNAAAAAPAAAAASTTTETPAATTPAATTAETAASTTTATETPAAATQAADTTAATTTPKADEAKKTGTRLDSALKKFGDKLKRQKTAAPAAAPEAAKDAPSDNGNAQANNADKSAKKAAKKAAKKESKGSDS